MEHVWISIKEKLPTKDGLYVTFTKTKIIESFGFTLFMDGEFMSSFVTHWMELQKPK